MIEGQLENIVTDVKKNLNAIVTRGEKFDDLQKKSEDLNNHVSTTASMTTNLVFCDAKKSQIGEVIKWKEQFITGIGLVCLSDNHVYDDVRCYMKLSKLYSTYLGK